MGNRYQIVTLINRRWSYGVKYDTLEAAKWHIKYMSVNPNTIVIDLTTGEIVYEK